MYRNTVSEKIKKIADQALEKYGNINSNTLYSWDEIGKHNQRDDFWSVINGYVYDLTAYLPLHPGGFNLLFRCGGADATNDFEAMFHSRNAKLILECFCIGRVKNYSSSSSLRPASSVGSLPPPFKAPFGIPSSKPSSSSLLPSSSTATSSSSSSSLNNSTINVSSTIIIPTEIPPNKSNSGSTITSSTSVVQPTKTKITNKEKVSHDSYVIEMKAPKIANWITPLTHVSLSVNGDLFRSYTPIDIVKKDDNEYYLQFIIKGYNEGVAKQIVSLNVGDELLIRGPLETNHSFNLSKYDKEYIIGIAGGTGITPMLQTIKSLYHSDNSSINKSKVKFILIYSNKTTDDILLKKELDSLQQNNIENISIYYLLTKESSTSSSTNTTNSQTNTYYGSRINQDTLIKILKNHSSIKLDNFEVLICGPKTFNQSVQQLIESIGFTNTNSSIIHTLE